MKTALRLLGLCGLLASVLAIAMSGDAGAFNYLLCDSGGCSVTYADNAGNVKYGNVAVVAKGGTGDYADPVAAMSDIAAWCATPSATNPCLLKIMPGVYDIGASTLQMQQYVDIEGSGENSTVIQGTLDSPTAGVVNGASFAEIRFLTIKSTGAGAEKYAMYNNGVSPKVTNVTAIATGSSTSTGSARAFYNTGSTLTMTNVTAEASGTKNTVAIVNWGSPSPGATLTNVKATTKPPGGLNSYAIYNANAGSLAVMSNVSAEASGASSNNIGIYNADASAILITVTAKGTGSAPASSYGVYSNNGPSPLCPSCTVTIQNSMIMGSTGAIGRVDGSVAIPTRVAGSQLVGAVSGGNVTCAGVYDETYTFYASSCPP